MKNDRNLTNISLFTGAMGLDLGLEKAGFRTLVSVEMDRYCASTIRSNRPSVHVLERDLCKVTTQEILDAARLRRGDADLISGGPPCQPFSTAGRRASIRDIRGKLFLEFLRVVREAQPRFFIMENVSGILSAAMSHRPLNRRGGEHLALKPNERPGSALKYILAAFRKLGYTVNYGLVNSADYGVPQVRERVFFVGSREGIKVPFPEPTHAKDGANDKPKWRTFADAVAGLQDDRPVTLSISKRRANYLKRIPEGGNWKDLPRRLQKQAMGNAFYSSGGRTGYYRRISFDRPTPTLVTSPNSKATSLFHPNQMRPLSVREYARIQQFPDEWKLCGFKEGQYRQLGNAVPVGLGYAFGLALRECIESKFLLVPNTPSKRRQSLRH